MKEPKLRTFTSLKSAKPSSIEELAQTSLKIFQFSRSQRGFHVRMTGQDYHFHLHCYFVLVFMYILCNFSYQLALKLQYFNQTMLKPTLTGSKRSTFKDSILLAKIIFFQEKIECMVPEVHWRFLSNFFSKKLDSGKVAVTK